MARKSDGNNPKSRSVTKSDDIPVTTKMFNELILMIQKLFDKSNTDLKLELHKMHLLVEEQNARNIFVMDSYNLVLQKLDEIETRIEKLENYYARK